MKKLVNVLTCLVFVLLLASVSFAKSEKRLKVVSSGVSLNCMFDSKCQQARQLAAGVAFQALVVCNDPDSFRDDRCTRANENAAASRVNADYICSVFPDGPGFDERIGRNRLPGNKQTTRRLKTPNLKSLTVNG